MCFCVVTDCRYCCIGTGALLPNVAPPSAASWRDERLQWFRRSLSPDTNQPLISSSFTFRVASFNILAPEYARTVQAETVFFPYCSKFVLEASYRLPQICAELTALDCDIVGLQEWYGNFLFLTCALFFLGSIDSSYPIQLTLWVVL